MTYGSIAAPSAASHEWARRDTTAECALHQLAPYIGKLKPVIARELVERFTSPGDLVLDCFSGSGTIPLEAVLLGRSAVAFDSNPYAVTLTRAKLEAPQTLADAVQKLQQRLAASMHRPKCDPEGVPTWVRKFFHPATLISILQFADECIEADDQFLLACLLGILHHQRPGFLSYPSSHLVPYLRDRKFPRDEYPDMYEERTLAPRMQAKVGRAFRKQWVRPRNVESRVSMTTVAALDLNRDVDAIVTSPPYMNALDYVRDNRLRMWFLDRTTSNYSPEPTDKREQFDAMIHAFATNALARLKAGGRCVLIVGETVVRKRTMSHPAEQILTKLLDVDPSLVVEHVIQDEIPDIRRSRRAGAATKRELVLVLKKPGLSRQLSREGSGARQNKR